MGDGGDVLLVPHRRKNRINQARQAATAPLRPMTVERDHARMAEIADGDGPSSGRWQGDAEAAVPKDARPRGQPNWPGRAGKLTQNKNAVTPMNKAATAERMPSARSSGEHPAQPGDSLASGRIRLAANGSDNRLERPLGNLRWCESKTGIKNSEPGGMQNYRLSE